MRRLAMTLVLPLLAGSLGLAASAQAGTYSVWACANGAGKPLAAGDWTANKIGAAALATTTCGAPPAGGTAGNLQAVAGPGPGQADTDIGASWNLAAVSGTKITGLDVWWSNQAGIESPGRVQVYAGTTSLYARDSGAFGNAAVPFDDANHQAFAGLNDDSVALAVWCTFTCTRMARSLSAVYQAYRTKVTVSDDVAPTGEATGPVDGQTISGPVTLTARASDTGSGVHDIQLVVDGNVVDSKATGGQCDDIDPTTGDAKDYGLMRPCVAQLPAAGLAPVSFAITPALLGNGDTHTVAIVAHDAAANAGTLLTRQVLIAPALRDGAAPPGFYASDRDLFFNPDVDVTGPAQPNGSNAGPATVAISFLKLTRTHKRGKRKTVSTFPASRTVSYSAGARAVGSLKTPAGLPIATARVYLATSTDGAPWVLSGPALVTDPAGSVSFVLPGHNPSRRVALVYFPLTSSNASFRSDAILMRVKAPVGMSLSRRSVRRGTRVSITARLRAGMKPGATVLAALQLRRGRSWHTIRQLRFTPRSGGRARTALRLHTPSIYHLRLRVSAQPGMTYTTGVSRGRALRVR